MQHDGVTGRVEADRGVMHSRQCRKGPRHANGGALVMGCCHYCTRHELGTVFDFVVGWFFPRALHFDAL